MLTWSAPIAGSIDYIVFSSSKLVRGIIPGADVFSDAIMPFSTASTRAQGMYFAVQCDVQNGRVFFVDIMDNVIHSMNIDGTGNKVSNM